MGAGVGVGTVCRRYKPKVNAAKKQTFDPHQYAIDGGWTFAEISATALKGVADEDKFRIRDYYEDEDVAENAIQLLEAWCIALLEGNRPTPAQETRAKVYTELGYRPAGMVGEMLTVARRLPSGKKGFIVQIIAPSGNTVRTLVRRK